MGYFGCHLSASGGNAVMVKTALSIGANTFAFFTRNPRGSKARPEDPADTAEAAAMLEENHFGKLVAHGAYTMNLCTADADARAFAAGFWRTICGAWRRFPEISTISIPAVTWGRGRRRESITLPPP